MSKLTKEDMKTIRLMRSTLTEKMSLLMQQKVMELNDSATIEPFAWSEDDTY